MMQNEASGDLRVRRTRKLLRDAFMELTTEKGFAAVTVQDITERAMVNRATFYRHYQDKYALAMALIEDVLAELKSHQMPIADQMTEQFDDPSPVMLHLFEHIAEHKQFYRVLLVKDAFPALERQIQTYVEQVMRHRLLADGYDPQHARLPFDLCIATMVSTALGMIMWWLEHGEAYSAHQMALWLPQVSKLGLQYALGVGAHEGASA